MSTLIKPRMELLLRAVDATAARMKLSEGGIPTIRNAPVVGGSIVIEEIIAVNTNGAAEVALSEI